MTMMLQEKVSVALFVLVILSIYGFEAIWLSRTVWKRIRRREKKNPT